MVEAQSCAKSQYFWKKWDSSTCQEVRTQQNMEPQYFCIFPSAFFYFLILSETATGLNMTTAVLFMSTYSYFQGFVWCYNDMTQCGYCCSFTGIFGFNSCWAGAFHYCHTYSTQKQLLQTQNALLSFGRSNMWKPTAKWEKLSPQQSSVPSWAWIHLQINPVPSVTRAALKSWKIRKLKTDFSLPKFQDILNIIFKPSEEINENKCSDTFFK